MIKTYTYKIKPSKKVELRYQNLKMKDFKLVHAYFVNKKLKDSPEEDFINHWENIFR